MDEIIGRWVASDAAAGEVLYQRYYHRVREFIVKRGATLVDAEDIAQEPSSPASRGSRPAASPSA